MKRVFSFLLVLLLVASLMPVQAMAETSGAHSVTVNIEGSGAASASPATASAGETVTIYSEADSGFELKEITGVGPAGSFQIYPYDDEFTMPNGDVTVTVKFGSIGDSDDSESYVTYMYFEDGAPQTCLGMDSAAAAPGSRYTFVPLEGYTIARVDAYDTASNLLPVDANHSVVVPAFGGVSAFVWLTQGSGNGGGGNPQPTEYNITVTDPENGDISTDVSKAKKDDTVTVTATPAEGYELEKITVTCNGNEVSVTDGKFTMPEGDVTVTASFKAVTPQPAEYNVTLGDPENGSVTVSATKAKKDDTLTVTATPAEGYELEKITVAFNGTEIPVTDGKFTMPEGDVTVTASFKTVQVQPSGLSFSYAYDVYRTPDFPKKNGTFRVYNFSRPLDADGDRIANAGIWTLTGMGNYSSFKNPSSTLSTVANGIAREYGVSANDLPIHKLTLNGDFITYGVLVMHDPSEPVAFFIGSNWSGGSGYLFSNVQQSGSKEFNVTTDITDDVPSEKEKVQVTFNPNSGNCATSGSELESGSSLEEMPSANRDGYVFTGWFTEDGTPVTEDTVFTEDTTVHARWAAHTTVPANNAYQANINMTNQAVVNMLVTQNDMEQGQDVRVYMEVEHLDTSAVPSGDHTAITNKANGKKIASFLDIRLLKQIGNGTPQPIANTKNNMVPITMKLTDAVIPSNAGKDSFCIIYHHVEGGTATTAEIPATFDVASKTLTFQANQFSTYALVWKDKTPSGTLDEAVKAGDISGLDAMPLLLLFCAVALAGVAVYDKKRTR